MKTNITPKSRARAALDEGAESPRFIETVPRRGYRFIGPVDKQSSDSPSPGTPKGQIEKPASTELRMADGRKLWRTVASTTLLVIALGGIFAWLSRPLPAPKVLNTIQLTHDGVSKQGLLTDGSRLYITERAGNASFLVQGSVTGGDTSVIPTPFVDTTAFDISGNHSQLLVTDRVHTQRDVQVWVLPLPTGNPYRLSNIIAHSAAWSPDGRQLAFAKGADILLANKDGTSTRRLITVPGSADWIRFSPDGSHLRFTLNTLETNSSSIWEVRADGSHLHALLPGWRSPPSECCGVWSADGRYYFFVSPDSARSNIWVLPETEGLFHNTPSTPLQVASGPMSLAFPVTSPDGRTLFANGFVPHRELVFYDRASQHFLPFLWGLSAWQAAFSRDGKWVTYVQTSDSTLWRSRIDGSERLQLTFPPVSPFLPFWSPDGKQIAFTNIQTGQPTKIFLVSAQGGAPEEMLSEREYQWDANWSPDGRKIIFGRPAFIAETYSKKIALHLLDLDSRQVSTLPGSENLFAPRWSPDGQHLAALSSDMKRLLLFDFKTQKWTDWISESGGVFFPVWSPDGTYVSYNTGTKQDPWYCRIKVGQTRPELLIDLKDLHFDSWSDITPDGSVIFSRDLGTDEIYSLQLDLP